MTALLAILAMLSGSAAAWLCYLASPQQQYAATCRHCPGGSSTVVPDI